MERTLVILKPDAVQRQLTGRIISRIERKGLTIVGMKMLSIQQNLAEKIYAPHKGADFYEALLRFITAGAVVAMVLEGNQAVRVVRAAIGATFGPDAAPGTIRGDFAMSRRYNLIHASDSPDSAAREIPLFFGPKELVNDAAHLDGWIYDTNGTEPL